MSNSFILKHSVIDVTVMDNVTSINKVSLNSNLLQCIVTYTILNNMNEGWQPQPVWCHHWPNQQDHVQEEHVHDQPDVEGAWNFWVCF